VFYRRFKNRGRSLNQSDRSAPVCVLRNSTVNPTHGETEASAKGVRSSTATLHGEALWNATPATPEGPLGRPSFFIATWSNCPRVYSLIPGKQVPRFSLRQMWGRSRNGLPFTTPRAPTTCYTMPQDLTHSPPDY
jgi:hypothetical protein